MGKSTTKALYRVFDKTRNKYISMGGKSKSSWQSESWAISAAESYAAIQTKDGYYVTTRAKEWARLNLEIHLFPVANAIVMPMSDYYKKMEETEAERKAQEELKKQKEEARKKNEQIKFLKDKIEQYSRTLRDLEGKPMK
jgi:hypothetical protein